MILPGIISQQVGSVQAEKLAIAGNTLLASAYNTGVPFQQQVQMLKSLGATFYRAPLRPSETGTLTTADQNNLFSTTLDQQYNGIIPQLLAEGIPTLAVVYDRLYNSEGNVSPLWGGTTQAAYDAGYLSTNQLVLDYGQYYTHYELSNEIDLQRKLKPGNFGMQASNYIDINGAPTPPIVGAYISGMNDGVKDANPSAVTMFNFTGYYPTYLMDQVLAAVATGTHGMDLISLHQYNEQPALLADQAGITDVIADMWSRWGKRIWITETGRRYNTGVTPLENEERQVTWFNGGWLQAAFASPHVEKIFWFELLAKTSVGDPDEDNYGLYSFYDYATNGFNNPQPKLLAQQLLSS